MSGITIDFMQVSLTSSQLLIVLTNGGFALHSSSGIAIAGEFAFSALNATSGQIGLAGQSGDRVNCTVTAQLTAGPSGSPTIEVSGFSGTATIDWSTPGGPQTHTLEPGQALALSGYSG